MKEARNRCIYLVLCALLPGIHPMCDGGNALSQTRTAASSASAPPSGAPRVLVDPLGSHKEVDYGRYRLVGADASTRYALQGSIRLTLTGDHAEAAADGFAYRIVAIAHVASGWLFVSADGTLARSDTFVGPLRRVADVDAPWDHAPTIADGRLALVQHGTLYTTDGSTPLQPVTALTPGLVLDAIFLDATTGMAVMADHRLLRTRDAGATWLPVPFEGTPTRVDRRGNVFYARGGDYFARVNSDGAVVRDRNGPQPFDADSGSLEASDSELDRALFARFPPAGMDRNSRTDGLIVDLVDNASDGTDLVAHQAGSRVPAVSLPNALPRGVCSSQTVGSHTLITCVNDHSTLLHGYSEAYGDTAWAYDFGPERTLREIGPIPSELRLAPNAAYAVFRGACPQPGQIRADDQTTDHRACIVPLAQQTPPHEVGIQGFMFAACPRSVVVESDDHAGGPQSLTRVALDGSGSVPIHVPQLPAEDRVELRNPQCTDNDTLILRVRDRNGDVDNTHLVVMVDRSNSGQVRSLPPAATSVAFHGAVDALAWGSTGDQLWYSRDGAQSWTPLRLPMYGESTQLTQAGPSSCVGSACMVGPGVRIDWAGGAATRASDTVLAPRDRLSESPRAALPELQCTAETLPAPARPAATDDHTALFGAVDGARVVLLVRAGSPPERSIRVQWHGSDRNGEYDQSTQWTSLSPTPSTAALNVRDGFDTIPVSASRNLVIVQRCAPTMEGGARCELLEARPGSAIRRIDVADTMPPRSDVSPRERGEYRQQLAREMLMRRPWLLEATDSDQVLAYNRAGLTFLIHIDAQGRATRSNGMRFEPARSSLLRWYYAKHAGHWGLALTTDSRRPAVWFYDLGGSPGTPVVPVNLGELSSGAGPCGDTLTAPDVLLVSTDHAQFVFGPNHVNVGVTRLEIREGNVCVRRIGPHESVWRVDPSDDALDLESGGGVLAGVDDDGRERSRVRCTIASARGATP